MLYRKYVLSYIKIFMGYGWGKVMATLGLGESGPKHTHESNAKWLKKKKSFVFEWQRVWQSNQDTVEGPEESSSRVMDTDGAKLVLDRRIVQLSSSSCRSHEHLVRISDRDCCCRRRPYKFIHFFTPAVWVIMDRNSTGVISSVFLSLVQNHNKNHFKTFYIVR